MMFTVVLTCGIAMLGAALFYLIGYAKGFRDCFIKTERELKKIFEEYEK